MITLEHWLPTSRAPHGCGYASPTLVLAMLGVLTFWTSPGEAQILSPGELSHAHEALDSLTKCTSCHGGAKRISAERCFTCHLEIGRRVQAHKGLHGQLKTQKCESCHPEHKGRTHALVNWGGNRRSFKHGRTGWPLSGAHAKTRCEDCHDKRHIVDRDIKSLLKKTKGKTTHLGLSRSCASCHFDQHRGQVGRDCVSCHQSTTWKDAPAFDHGKTKYPLKGRHRRVRCASCHPKLQDSDTLANAFPPPKSMSYLRFSPLDHRRCSECHKDPHQGHFGPRCEDCHNVSGWKHVRAELRNRDFHEKARFKLRGRHAAAPCAGCHGPFQGQRKPRYKRLKFERCQDCHPDGHQGQIKRQACEHCHTVDGFSPAQFEVEDHQKTAYPLVQAHLATACSGCHATPLRGPRRLGALPPSQRVQRRMRQERRPQLQSTARFALGKAPFRCAGCHANPHGAQFKKALKQEGCEGCHEGSSFRQVRFDHSKGTRFALEGAHTKARCSQCHFQTVKVKGKTTTLYRNAKLRCADCHTDPHLGQMNARHPKGCKDCHSSETFKRAQVDHSDPRQTAYPLEGAHTQLKCERCHPSVRIQGRKTFRYKPLPRRCEGCHKDFHKARFAVLSKAAMADPSRKAKGCAGCHSVKGWGGASFDHLSTGWPLKGAHLAADCRGCHKTSFVEPIATRCGDCHQDPHLGRLGTGCERCHQESDWRSDFGAIAHRESGFPLTGRHGQIPCVECHQEARERTFTAIDRECVSCHEADYLRTGLTTIDHVQATFGTECQRCHAPSTFAPATFPEHDACFLITRGPHRALRCGSCHDSLAGLRPTGSCLTRNATCTGCHAHDQDRTDGKHQQVAGYQYKDRKCYECHRISG